MLVFNLMYFRCSLSFKCFIILLVIMIVDMYGMFVDKNSIILIWYFVFILLRGDKKSFNLNW